MEPVNLQHQKNWDTHTLNDHSHWKGRRDREQVPVLYMQFIAMVPLQVKDRSIVSLSIMASYAQGFSLHHLLQRRFPHVVPCYFSQKPSNRRKKLTEVLSWKKILRLTSRTQEALSISHLRVLGFQPSVRIDVVLCWEDHLALGLSELLQQFCGARSKEYIIAKDRQERDRKEGSQQNMSAWKVSGNSQFFRNPFLLVLLHSFTCFCHNYS